MKRLQITISDYLSTYVSYNISDKIAYEVLEYGFKSLDILVFDIYDFLADQDGISESTAKELALGFKSYINLDFKTEES